MRRRALCLSVNELSDRYGIDEKSLREWEPLRLTAKTLGTSASGQPCGSAAALRTAGIGAPSPFARAPAKDRDPPDPVVRAKGRFRIRKSYSRSEADQPFLVDLGFWVRF
jgi:hypothetical protein